MRIDELKELLAAGTITQDQFDAMAKAIDPNYTENPEQPEQNEADGDEAGNNQQENVEKLIQRAVDRATNRLGNENKKLRQQIETIKKTKLTENEAAELERKEREAELEERERALLEKEHSLYAIKAIKAAGLDDGSDKALELVEFVIAGSEEDIDAKVKAFGDLVRKFVKAEVDRTFKSAGRTPRQGNGRVERNPYAKDTCNITEQMRLEISDPELAKKLKAAAE